MDHCKQGAGEQHQTITQPYRTGIQSRGTKNRMVPGRQLAFQKDQSGCKEYPVFTTPCKYSIKNPFPKEPGRGERLIRFVR